MLYLDSSALVKKYLTEPGSHAVAARLTGSEVAFTSALSYAEIHAVLARKLREGGLDESDLRDAKDRFHSDWVHSLRILELDTRTLGALQDLVLRYPLKGADAVHVSSALWLRDYGRLPGIAFWAADKSLLRVASDCGLSITNPETA